MIEAARMIGAGAVTLLLVTAVLTSVAGVVQDNADTEGTGAAAIQNGDGTLALPAGAAIEEHTKAQTTLGDAASFDGSSAATVTLDTDANPSGNRALCTWTTANAVSTHRVITSFNNLVLSYDGSTGEWRGYYYDAESRSSYALRATATSPPTPTLLCLQIDGSALELFENSTAVASTTIDGSGTASAPPDKQWQGRVEETRVFNTTLSGSQQDEWLNEPVLAVANQPPAVRLMYDTRDRGATTIPAFFASGDATRGSGVAFVDGFSGPPIDRGTDYVIDGFNNEIITVLNGGILEEDGEVVYASFLFSQLGALINRIIQIGTAALGLLVVGLVVIAARTVSGAFGDGL